MRRGDLANTHGQADSVMRLRRQQTEGTHPKIKSLAEEKGVAGRIMSPQNDVSALTPRTHTADLTWGSPCGRRPLEVAAHCAAL